MADTKPTTASDMPTLPDLPKPQTPFNAFNNLSALFAISQGNPAMLPQAFQAVADQRAQAEREAELQYRRELDNVNALEAAKQGAQTEADRQAAMAENKRQFNVTTAANNEAEAARRAHELVMEKLADKQLTETHRNQLQNTAEILSKRYEDARDQARIEMSGGQFTGKQRALGLGDLARLRSDPMTNVQYMQIQKSSGQAAADTWLADQAKSQQAALATQSGFTGTTTELNRRATEIMQANPATKLLLKDSGLELKDLIPPNAMPYRVEDLSPAQIGAVRDMSVNLVPKMLGGQLDGAEAKNVAADLTILGMGGKTAVLADRMGEAVTLYWEEQYGWPRDRGEDTLAEIIKQNLSPEGIQYNTPTPAAGTPGVSTDTGLTPEELKAELKGGKGSFDHPITKGEFKGYKRKFFQTEAEAESTYTRKKRALVQERTKALTKGEKK